MLHLFSLAPGAKYFAEVSINNTLVPKLENFRLTRYMTSRYQQYWSMRLPSWERLQKIDTMATLYWYWIRSLSRRRPVERYGYGGSTKVK